MTTPPSTETANANPFDDPAGLEIERMPDVPEDQLNVDNSDVLTVDRNATLTLGTDSLVVLDEGLRHRRAAVNCCGLLPRESKTTKAIPFYNILWAEVHDDFDVNIHYAEPRGRKGCKVASINYTITDKSLHSHAKLWIEKLMLRAYPSGPMNTTQRKKRVKVLINPFGGQGYAQKIWTSECEPVFAAARCELDVERTAYRGHAVEIAEKMDLDAYDVVACASGDGLPHEVFNGLAKHINARQALRKVAVVQLPCGSGNAMCLNLNGTDLPSLAALAIVKGIRTPLDLVAITQGSNKYYSFLSQAVGIVAESDLGTDSLRWMGPLRFTWGILVRLMGRTIYPAEVSMVIEDEDKRKIKETWRRAMEEHRSRGSSSTTATDTSTVNESDNGYLPPLRYGTVQDSLHSTFQTIDMPDLGNFYVGNMCWMTADAAFFSTSLPSDGKMDMINISGLTSRATALRMLMTVGDGSLIDFPEVSYRKVAAYRITPRNAPRADGKGWGKRVGRWLGGAGKQKDGLIAIDGESVPFEPFQAEVVQGLGTVLSKSGGVYECDGLKDL